MGIWPVFFRTPKDIHMKSILYLFSLFLMTATWAANRPNVILIMADDMGYESLGANGGKAFNTPRIDALAAEGMRFKHCHSQPICTPSRVQIMTGNYNSKNYLKFGLLDPEAKTFGHLFQDAGYKTCIAGKWQLGGGFDQPGHFGFDEYCLWQLTRRPGRYVNPGFEVNGKAVDYTEGEYGPDIASNYILDFIERNKDGEFFVWYPMIPPHWPFEPPPGHPDYDKTAKSNDRNRKAKYFPPMVEHVDTIVGRIEDKLKALGLRENTLIIFTGDNGNATELKYELDGKPYPGGKGSTRDNGTHVPLVVSWPGTIQSGVVSDELVDFSDMLPTIADAAGIAVPSDWGVDGHSFVPHLKGDTAYKSREWIYCWYERNGNRGKESQHTRNQTLKLYGTGKLFNVMDDFEEKHALDIETLNAAQRKQYKVLKESLDRQMAVNVEATAVVMKKKGPEKKKKEKKEKAAK
ncbi:MAG: arylsulfatase A [Verrucomicrobiales bacterium]|jgi:arylsulfatase A